MKHFSEIKRKARIVLNTPVVKMEAEVFTFQKYPDVYENQVDLN